MLALLLFPFLIELPILTASSPPDLLLTHQKRAVPNPVKPVTYSAPFTLHANRPGSPLHHQPVFAANSSFYIPLSAHAAKPRTSCPLADKSQCPPGDQTVFLVTTDQRHAGSLDVAVPSGQEVYISPTGAFGFADATPPGSSISNTPAYSYIGGFIEGMPSGHRDGVFTWDEGGGLHSVWFACPVPRRPLWQILTNRTRTGCCGFVDQGVPSGRVKDCFEVGLLARNYTGVGKVAWEYD